MSAGNTMPLIPIIKSLSILALVMVAGWLSRRSRILASQDTKVLSAFVYNFALPALFLYQIARIDFKAIGIGVIAMSLLPLVLIFVLLLSLRIAAILSKDRFVLLGLSVAFSSNAFFGVPFFESLYGQWGLGISIVTGSFLSIFGIFSSVALFEYASGNHKWFFVFIRVLKSPLIISIAAGLALNPFRQHTSFFTNLFIPLGHTASGVAVFMLGMFVYDQFSLETVKKAFSLVLFRIMIIPLMTGIVLLLFRNIAFSFKQFLFLQSGIPAAVSVAIFATRYQYKIDDLTGMVVLSSMASFLTLGVLYLISVAFQ